MSSLRFMNLAGLRAETVTVAVAGVATNPTTFPVPDGVSVVVMAHPSNTGTIKVGSTAANAQSAVGVNNIPLAANVSASFQLTDPLLLFIDATVAGERAIVFFET